MKQRVNVTRYASQERSRHREDNAQRVYDYIVTYFEENGFSPSMKEIGEGCFFSRGTVVRYLDLLEARGYIEREYNVPRSIHVLDPNARL